MVFFGNMPDSPDSPTFAKYFARTRQTRRHLPNHFARLARLADIHQAVLWGLTKLVDIRQMPIWWKTAPFFSRFGEFGKFSKYSHLPKWPFTEIFVTCRHSPCHFARTPQTRRHLPNALFKKMWLALLNSRESCKFGASSHCLVLTQVINRHSYDFFLFNHRKMFELFLKTANFDILLQRCLGGGRVSFEEYFNKSGV